ncbi:tRNA (adenosine(37)-N6)-threonylcarbamoyltransferase complex dimerization subunit type 1 TsaB [Sulfitobacter sp.]|uniref:tRNA (adenosine(37)-N6)-threonylcarbamoyltransferase complex dimerization subunit type 1 TsaB n=1 Tax=Sulfitobacter sp. TaxID=1903071 RepID=UPI003003504F
MRTPLILALDTAAAHCAVAVLSGDQILASCEEVMAKGQAERLLALVEELLAEAGVQMHQLDAIGVGIGPGNFTGIRIAVSAARGLALALDIPAVGVSAFDALRFGTSGPCICIVDARREMVFTQGFETDILTDPALVSFVTLPTDVPMLGAFGATPAHPVAVAIARITALRYADAPTAPAPLYLRAADAAPARDAPPQIVP